LHIVAPDGTTRGAFAFNSKIADGFYTETQDGKENPLFVAGNKLILKDFEKVGTAHVLAVQYDPGRTPVYIGFSGIILALCSVFFFAHQRMWAVIEPDGKKSKVYIGGNTNRNKGAFEPRFGSFVELATERGGQTNE
jgi:cytochrome c biogenesis protein ResB